MKRKAILITSILLLLAEAAAGTRPVVPLMMRDSTRREAAERYADSVLALLTPRQQAAQLIMPMTWPKTDAAGQALWRRQVLEGEFGGVLWQKGDPAAVVELSNWMRREARVPMLVAMDGEWGLSMRFSGTTPWPRNIILGATDDPHLAYEYGAATADEARRIGIHVNFAPVLDVNSNPDNPVIGTRSLSSQVERVTRLGLAYSRGLEEHGMMATAKHFPGHGDTSTDSHKTLPVIRRSRSQLEAVELPPFRAFVDSGFGGMMVAHLSIPALGTGDRATSATPAVVTDLLQREMGFEGLIFTDGLGMEGIRAGAGREGVAVTTLLAGADILLAPDDPFVALEEVCSAMERGVLPREEIERRCRKVLLWKHLLGADSREPLSTTGLDEAVRPESSQRLLERIYDAAMTLAKEDTTLIPLRKEQGKVAFLTYGNDSAETLRAELAKELPLEAFTLRRDADAATRKRVLDRMRQYDRVIVAVTDRRTTPGSDLTQLLRERRSLLLFHTTPYAALKYKGAIKAASAVAFAYDTRREGMQSMARALLGRIPFRGSLPVELPGVEL